MIVATINISYDRGLTRNTEDDLKENPNALIRGKGSVLPDGGVIRGLGTKFRTEDSAKRVKERDQYAKEVYGAFRARFLATPIKGVYMIPRWKDGKKFQESLGHLDGVRVSVIEFELVSQDRLDNQDALEWAKKVKSQLQSVELGRKKDADEMGLRALLTLASCPILTKDTAERIRNAVAGVRSSRIDKLELRRQLSTLEVGVSQDTLLSPRRAPVVV